MNQTKTAALRQELRDQADRFNEVLSRAAEEQLPLEIAAERCASTGTGRVHLVILETSLDRALAGAQSA